MFVKGKSGSACKMGWICEMDRLHDKVVFRQISRDQNKKIRARFLALFNSAKLKVVGNEKIGGSGMCQSAPIWLGPRRSRFVSLNFTVVFDFTYFCFRPSNAK